ncbi:hypothetical protein FRC12_007577 [Ceratobasidium sp. 428]|nr:hypothetical protein FRC12_007577 [Ceratobasidium sp. 428]
MDDGAEHLLLCWFIKAALLISDARVTRKTPLATDGEINQWFGLETQRNDCFQDLEEDIADALTNKQSFLLCICTLLLPSYSNLAAQQSTLFYDRDTPLGKVTVNVPRSICAILTEEWSFALDCAMDDLEPITAYSYAQKLQHGVMLIRSLYSLLQTSMPAWNLYQHLSVNMTMQLVVEASLFSTSTRDDTLKLGKHISSTS